MKKAALSPDSSCYRGLKWRLELDLPGCRFIELEKGLRKRGFKSCLATLFPAVLGFKNELGHEIILVPKTSRIQIRVHYTIPQNLRGQAAMELVTDIVDAMPILAPSLEVPLPDMEIDVADG